MIARILEAWLTCFFDSMVYLVILCTCLFAIGPLNSALRVLYGTEESTLSHRAILGSSSEDV